MKLLNLHFRNLYIYIYILYEFLGIYIYLYMIKLHKNGSEGFRWHEGRVIEWGWGTASLGVDYCHHFSLICIVEICRY